MFHMKVCMVFLPWASGEKEDSLRSMLTLNSATSGPRIQTRNTPHPCVETSNFHQALQRLNAGLACTLSLSDCLS